MCVSLFYRIYRQFRFRLMRIATASGHAHFCCSPFIRAHTDTSDCRRFAFECSAERRHTAKHCLCTKLRHSVGNIRQIFAKLSGGVRCEWNAQTVVEQRVVFCTRARLCVVLFDQIYISLCASNVASVNLMKTDERDANKSYANSNYPSLRRPC